MSIISLFLCRPVGSGEQCRQICAHRSTGLDAFRGFYKGFECKSHGTDRRDPAVPAPFEERSGQGGECVQHPGQTVNHRWRILPV